MSKQTLIVDINTGWATRFLMTPKDFATLCEILERSERVERNGYSADDSSWVEVYVEDSANIRAEAGNPTVITMQQLENLKTVAQQKKEAANT